jgi:glycerophosphoryl diester phosphodiesterase
MRGGVTERHRGRALLAASVVAALLASGCSSGSDDAAGTTSSTSATTTAPTAPSSTAAPTTTTTVAPTTSSTAAAPTTTATAPAARTIADLLALGRPIVLAHTGGEDAYPGSTMFAFGESVKAGVDMLDLNVMLTADDVLVVQHDDTVDRLTESTGPVASMTFAELSRLDNAYWFTTSGVGTDHPEADYLYRGVRTGAKPPPDGYSADDFAIPRLSDLIARFPEAPLNIEIEGDGEPAARAAAVLAQLLHDTGREQASIVTSFDDATVTAFHALAPDVELSPGLGASTAWVLSATALPDGMRILQLPPEYQGVEVLSPATVAASHAAGYLIWVWPNEAEDAALYDSLLAQGMDGLNANYPIEAVAAIERFAPA